MIFEILGLELVEIKKKIVKIRRVESFLWYGKVFSKVSTSTFVLLATRIVKVFFHIKIGGHVKIQFNTVSFTFRISDFTPR